MKISHLAGLLVALSVVLSGCATRGRMAFEDDAEQITEQSKPVYLMAVTVKNSYRTYFHPRLHVVHVEKPGTKDAVERIDFAIDDKAKMEDVDAVQDGHSYLLRMELDPGRYELKGLDGIAVTFPFFGHFAVPVHSDLTVDKPGVYYLGRLEATVRERQGNEFRAGPVAPLLDQAVAGASGGTYDIAITDAFGVDEAVFRSRFPALKGVVIAKAVLPPFDRARSQAWWEAH